MKAARIALVLLLSSFPFDAQAESPSDAVVSLPSCAVSKPEQMLDEADLVTAVLSGHSRYRFSVPFDRYTLHMRKQLPDKGRGDMCTCLVHDQGESE